VTLDEAQQLAHLVEQSEDWIVTAIGRFVLLDELQQAVAGGFDRKLPWMVAIMAVGDVKTLTKLTSTQDWNDLQIPATKRPKPEPKEAICEPKPVKTETTCDKAVPHGMLF
jgi:hypothetical protein